MARRPDARALLFERIRTSPPKFVHVRGVPYTVAVEENEDPSKVDHVYLNVEVPPFGRLRVAINTLSRMSRDAGARKRPGGELPRPSPGHSRDLREFHWRLAHKKGSCGHQ